MALNLDDPDWFSRNRISFLEKHQNNPKLSSIVSHVLERQLPLLFQNFSAEIWNILSGNIPLKTITQKRIFLKDLQKSVSYISASIDQIKDPWVQTQLKERFRAEIEWILECECLPESFKRFISRNGSIAYTSPIIDE